VRPVVNFGCGFWLTSKVPKLEDFNGFGVGIALKGLYANFGIVIVGGAKYSADGFGKILHDPIEEIAKYRELQTFHDWHLAAKE
jgi:hypothetical protein